jgi:thioredoxin-like negative regulator of GroEL
MSVYFLNSNDFEVIDGQFLYKFKRPELTLIFFYSTDCPHCKPVLPMIQQLAYQLHGCKYALLNVKVNYSAAMMSRSTSTPINYVPMALLYYAGRPVQKFSSAYSIENLRNFIIAASKNVKNLFSAEKPQTEAQAAPAKEPPAFSTGTPFCDSETGVCYLNFDNAYGETRK